MHRAAKPIHFPLALLIGPPARSFVDSVRILLLTFNLKSTFHFWTPQGRFWFAPRHSEKEAVTPSRTNRARLHAGRRSSIELYPTWAFLA
jgi:hypothetical protein